MEGAASSVASTATTAVIAVIGRGVRRDMRSTVSRPSSPVRGTSRVSTKGGLDSPIRCSWTWAVGRWGPAGPRSGAVRPARSAPPAPVLAPPRATGLELVGLGAHPFGLGLDALHLCLSPAQLRRLLSRFCADRRRSLGVDLALLLRRALTSAPTISSASTTITIQIQVSMRVLPRLPAAVTVRRRDKPPAESETLGEAAVELAVGVVAEALDRQVAGGLVEPDRLRLHQAGLEDDQVVPCRRSGRLELGKDPASEAGAALLGYDVHPLDLGAQRTAERPDRRTAPGAGADRDAVEVGDEEQPLGRDEHRGIDRRLVGAAVALDVLLLDPRDQRTASGWP